MKQNVFLAILILIGFSSCKPKKAIEFREAIVKKERTAFAIIVGKEGPGEKRRYSLVENDFKRAALATDEEERALDSLIRDIQILSTEGVKQGEQLKSAAVNYYIAVKELQAYSRREIEQQVINAGSDREKIYKAQDSLYRLAVNKEELYNKVYKKEAAFQEALRKFEIANNI
ncbi:MAG TPA: hypothetical protein VJ720_03935 [Chitinophaga sp.]|nr:hypothetical protein [Chitinophaga sp.]